MTVIIGVKMQVLNYEEKLTPNKYLRNGLGKSTQEARKHSTQFESMQGLPLMYMKERLISPIKIKIIIKLDLKEKNKESCLDQMSDNAPL